MAHQSYLRVNGNALFKFHSLEQLLEQQDGDPVAVIDRIATLRDAADRLGVGPVTVMAGPPMDFDEIGRDLMEIIDEQIDGLANYTLVPDVKARSESYPYEQLMDYSEGVWDRYLKDAPVPYRPALSAGWNPIGTWSEEEGPHGRQFDLPEPAQWQAALERAKSTLDSYNNAGIPDGTGGVKKALHMYAWNEWGEGGMIGPNVHDGWAKLTAIQEVFERSSTATTPVEKPVQ